MESFRSLFSSLLIASTVLSSAADSSAIHPRQDNAPLVTWNGKQYRCKCYSTDSCWPAATAWSTLNTTVGGNLFQVIPPGAACYTSFKGMNTYNQQACSAANTGWTKEDWQADQQVTNMWTFWTNNTCNPSAQRQNRECTLGNLPEYAIMAKTKEHIQAGVKFAVENNLRLLIRNTGHDFMGRSTGYGSLAINTHSFKSVTFVKNYTGPGNYKGSAVTVGAGIQVRELYRQAAQQNPKVVVVGGECPTVGLAGGYIQGGGHGPMASYYGMAADHALSFDIVSATGEFVTANAESNPDLFWALKGGGPSTFGVILSVTLKTFPEVPTAAVSLDITTTDQTKFWKGVAAFHNRANLYVENGMFVYYELFSGRLHIQPFVGPNMNKAKIESVLKPVFDQLKADGVSYTSSAREFSTFFDMYTAMFEDESAGFSGLVGGRLFTKKDIAENGDKIVNAYKTAAGGSGGLGGGMQGIIGHIVGPGYGMPTADNAVHPAWRNASSFSITMTGVEGNAPLSQKATAQDRLTNMIDKALRDASPNGAAYVNEGNLEEPNWQQAFWGSNYPRLLEIKKKWDPNGVFYARTTPGTEDWESIQYNTKLCKKV
ncbi:FAD binding domain-containing protein [Zopfia rhizophila CBS 207.26]|uniref:FAD binding domain-containing protein n=1 Tax=Zopfia rhizophila CBS 207.26 TaxID=1314779 RepID=A0A6A6E3S9_9PEZI|nr:FAD binding domain-containing protein [Zopfia rhizophila CBS 207.26]